MSPYLFAIEYYIGRKVCIQTKSDRMYYGTLCWVSDTCICITRVTHKFIQFDYDYGPETRLIIATDNIWRGHMYFHAEGGGLYESVFIDGWRR